MTTVEQRLTALQIANETRIRNAQLFRDLSGLDQRDGRDHVAELLLEAADTTGSVRVDRLLRSIRGVGASKATRILRRHGIFSDNPRVRKLTARQRHALAGALAFDGPLR